MPRFGQKSLKNLEGVHDLLAKCALEVVKIYDISVTQGVRSAAQQQKLYAIGRTEQLERKPVTKIDGVTKKSNHQIKEDGLGYAIDVNPFPIDFAAKERYYMMWGIFYAVSQNVLAGTDYKLRWGGDWDGDNSFTDQSFDDLPHIELIKK